MKPKMTILPGLFTWHGKTLPVQYLMILLCHIHRALTIVYLHLRGWGALFISDSQLPNPQICRAVFSILSYPGFQ
jgi:hypothetical protein